MSEKVVKNMPIVKAPNGSIIINVIIIEISKMNSTKTFKYDWKKAEKNATSIFKFLCNIAELFF